MGRRAVSVGERSHECGEPHRASGTFSIFEIKKKKKKRPMKNPTQKYSKAVGVFYWGLGG
jgi:hypothetical protein